MFIVFLRFSTHRARAAELMAGHNAWLKRGFDDGIFLAAGSLPPALGGGILAQAASHDELQRRLDEDPFVEHGVVAPEVIEFTPARADARLQFLVNA